MSEVVWSEAALSDFERIIEYIRFDSPTNAERIGKSLRDSPIQLIDFPKLGFRVPEFDLDTIRELLVHSYRVIYEIDGDICVVVAVIHGSRDLKRHFLPR